MSDKSHDSDPNNSNVVPDGDDDVEPMMGVSDDDVVVDDVDDVNGVGVGAGVDVVDTIWAYDMPGLADVFVDDVDNDGKSSSFNDVSRCNVNWVSK